MANRLGKRRGLTAAGFFCLFFGTLIVLSSAIYTLNSFLDRLIEKRQERTYAEARAFLAYTDTARKQAKKAGYHAGKYTDITICFSCHNEEVVRP